MFFSGLLAKIRAWYVQWVNSRRPPVQVTVVDMTRLEDKEMEMSPEQFITLFPPKKDHKACMGKGYHVQVVSVKGDGKSIQGEGYRKIAFCECVMRQYRASGRKIKLKEGING